MRKYLAVICGSALLLLGLIGTARAATGYFPSFMPNLGVGGDTIVGQSIRRIDAWIVGSGIFTGHLFFDTTNSTNPSVCVNSGCVMTYGADSNNLPGGGIRLTNSGADQLTAHWQIPTTYASGALLHRATLECGNIGRAVTGSLVINQATTKQGLTVGTQVRNHIRLSTGSVVTINTGALLNTKIFDSYYVSFITNGSGGAVLPTTFDCVMRPETHEKYGR